MKKDTLKLFTSFFKIGLFTFGGGYAMIPLIQDEAVEKQKWISDDDILEILAIAESTPGPIAINSATFIGSKVAGFWGAAAATAGVVLPSFLIISVISYFLEVFKDAKVLKYAFMGIRAGVLALIVKALWGMFKKSKKNLFFYIIASIALLFTLLLNLNVLIVLLFSATAGIVYSLWIRRNSK